MEQVIVSCKGCHDRFTVWDVSADGYCDACQYEHEAKLDNLTGGEDEHN
jgi:hypothetical protein